MSNFRGGAEDSGGILRNLPTLPTKSRKKPELAQKRKQLRLQVRTPLVRVFPNCSNLVVLLLHRYALTAQVDAQSNQLLFPQTGK